MGELPVHIEIELTNRCNLACVMCCQRPTGDQRGDMEPHLLSRILEETLPFPRRIFTFHGVGEPLLSGQLRPAVTSVKESPNRHTTLIVTNGVLLDARMRRLLLTTGVDAIRVSVGAMTPEAYEQVRGSRQLSRVVANTLRLVEDRDLVGARTQIGVQLVLVPPADLEVDSFIEFWSEVDVEIEIWRDFRSGRPPGAPRPPGVCRHLQDSTIIGWDGRVSLCCIDAERKYVLGNVADQSLEQIYNGPAMQQIRDAQARGDYGSIPLCAACAYRDESHIVMRANRFREARSRP